MKISHTWHNEEGTEMAWAEPSRREWAACRKAGEDEQNVLNFCDPPRGWDYADDDDSTDDGGNPGCYLVRRQKK